MPIQGLAGINTSRTDGPIRPLAKPRGLPAEYRGRILAEASDPKQAAGVLDGIFGANRLLTDPPVAPVRLHGVQLSSLALYYLDVQAAVTIDVPRLPAHQLVITPTSGTVRVATGQDELEATPFLASCPRPGESLRLERAHGDPVMIIVIEQDTLRRGVDALLGRSFVGAVAFDVGMDLARDGADRWQTALQLLHGEVARAGPEQRFDATLLPLESFLVATLLLRQGSTCHAALHRTVDVRHSRALRDVVVHIEANLGDPLPLAELAAVGNVSVRTLQLRFRESFDQTPTQYILDKRLDRVHADLLAAAPGVQTVEDIALRWGFQHEGRFAAAYRRRFGERPYATLSR